MRPNCECNYWATDNIHALDAQGHHPNCEHYTTPDMRDSLLRRLVFALECLSADADGLPDDVFAVYCEARDFLNQTKEADAHE